MCRQPCTWSLHIGVHCTRLLIYLTETAIYLKNRYLPKCVASTYPNTGYNENTDMKMNAEYFILDSLYLLTTKYTDFLREDWGILFNAPSNLELSQQERQSALNSMINNHLIWVDDGWCKLTAQGGAYWQTLFQVNWAGFYDCWFDNFCERNETEEMHFYCSSEETIHLLIKQHPRILAGYQIESLHNWQATYWKNLASGFYLKHTVPADFNQVGRIQLPKWKLELDEIIIF